MKRVVLYLMGFLWVTNVSGQLEVVNNAKMKFNGNNIFNVSQNGNVTVTSSQNFSLSPGLLIERISGNNSGGIFISEATAVVMWAGGYPNTNLVEFCQNTGTTFRRVSYINNAGSLVVSSDSVLKTSIRRLSGVSTKLQGIGAYRYQLKVQRSTGVIDTSVFDNGRVISSSDSSISSLTQSKISSLQQPIIRAVADTASSPEYIGFLAQELEKVFPELVETREGVKYVNYMGMVPILLQAINEQQTVINQQQQKLQQQESRINALQAEVAAIKKYLKIK